MKITKTLFLYYKPIIFILVSLTIISACGGPARVAPGCPAARPPTSPRVLYIWFEDDLVDPSTKGASGTMAVVDVSNRFAGIGIHTAMGIDAIGTEYPVGSTRDHQNVFYSGITAGGGAGVIFSPDAVGQHLPYSINNEVSPGAIELVLSTYTSSDPVWTRARACTCAHEIGHGWLDALIAGHEIPYHNAVAGALMNATVNAAPLNLIPPVFPEFLPAEQLTIEGLWP